MPKPLDEHEKFAAEIFTLLQAGQDMVAIGRLINALCEAYDQYEGFDRKNFQNICLRGVRISEPRLVLVEDTNE